MHRLSFLLSWPVELEIWLIFSYVLVVLVGARLFEFLARLHFARARRYAEQGFTYDPEEDRYHCPQGERLPLHLIDETRRVAVYRAPASACNGCPSKGSCTPHDHGRHIYRPLAAWAETDLGKFHQRLSLLMFAVGSVLSLAGLLRWGGQPGTGLLGIVFVGSFWFFLRDLRLLWAAAPSGLDEAA